MSFVFTEDFKLCTKMTIEDDGWVQIDCVFNQWSVAGMSVNDVQAEAWRYWQTYEQDGIYDNLLSEWRAQR